MLPSLFYSLILYVFPIQNRIFFSFSVRGEIKMEIPSCFFCFSFSLFFLFFCFFCFFVFLSFCFSFFLFFFLFVFLSKSIFCCFFFMDQKEIKKKKKFKDGEDIRLLVIGDLGVGKSALTMRLVKVCC